LWIGQKTDGEGFPTLYLHCETMSLAISLVLAHLCSGSVSIPCHSVFCCKEKLQWPSLLLTHTGITCLEQISKSTSKSYRSYGQLGIYNSGVRMPMSRRKMIKEDVIIAASQSQLFVPKTAEIGASNALGLNQMVWRRSWSSVVGSFSPVT
jgi:hypothetical protein